MDNVNIVLNCLSFKDFHNIKSNLLTNSFVVSSYELFNLENQNEITYHKNYLSFIDEYSNIIPLSYNIKSQDAVLGIDDNHIINVKIDNYTIKDSINLPKTNTITLSYSYSSNNSYDYIELKNIIDSYSYIIDSYSYIDNNIKYSYKIEYNYDTYINSYAYYNNETNINITYSYYPINYNYDSEDKKISYNIKYSYTLENTYYNYSYEYSYTYNINQFENEHLYVDQTNLDKANYDIGIFKADKDTMNIIDDKLSINKNYLDLIYCSYNISQYSYIYHNLYNIYHNIDKLSKYVNRMNILNYKPYIDYTLLFSNQDILYFDKNKKQKITNNSSIKIDNDINEFNICIPFDYKYKSNIGQLDNPIDIDKIFINIANKKLNESIKINNNEIELNNYFNLNNILKSNYQEEIESVPLSSISSYMYNIHYTDLDKYFNLNENIYLDIDRSYVIDNTIYKYENNVFYGSAKYVFNFKIKDTLYKETIQKLGKNNFYFYNFDIIIFIKDSIFENCNVINNNYKLYFNFYFENIDKYVQIYDVLYHDYNYGFNYEGIGNRIGLCFIPENFNGNPQYNNPGYPKPVFCKYDNINDINNTKIVEFNTLYDQLNKDSNSKLNNVSGTVINNDPDPVELTFNNNHEISINANVSIQENYYSDKIYNINFNHLKRGISPLITGNVSPMYINIDVDSESHTLMKKENNYNNYINIIYTNENKKILSPTVLYNYFPTIYKLTSSGLRKGDYYIPTINQYYMMSLYNILSVYSLINDTDLVSSITFTNEGKTYPIIAGVKNNKLYKIKYYNIDENNSNEELIKFAIPIFKIPDYSVLNDGNYNLYFDNDLNHEVVVISTQLIEEFSLNIKRYYSFNTTNWYVECNSNNVSNIKIIYENNKLNISYNYTELDKNDKILYFKIGYNDSDDSFNTDKINENDCRILCSVIIKIKS